MLIIYVNVDIKSIVETLCTCKEQSQGTRVIFGALCVCLVRRLILPEESLKITRNSLSFARW